MTKTAILKPLLPVSFLLLALAMLAFAAGCISRPVKTSVEVVTEPGVPPFPPTTSPAVRPALVSSPVMQTNKIKVAWDLSEASFFTATGYTNGVACQTNIEVGSNSLFTIIAPFRVYKQDATDPDDAVEFSFTVSKTVGLLTSEVAHWPTPAPITVSFTVNGKNLQTSPDLKSWQRLGDGPIIVDNQGSWFFKASNSLVSLTPNKIYPP